MKFVIGIDEAGRGPLAGPVTVGAFCGNSSMKNKLVKLLGGRVRDSKQISHKERERIFEELKILKISGKVDFSVAHSSPKYIDKFGISRAVQRGIDSCLKKIKLTSADIRLDGLLKASKEYVNQKTIMGGDAKDVFIACASIVAKVTRDRLMQKLAKKYPDYLFEIHKGYGTKLHVAHIKKLGTSPIHRTSFLQKI